MHNGHQQKWRTVTNKTEATTMQRYSECKFCWCIHNLCNNVNIFALGDETSHTDCHTLFFLLSCSRYFVKYWGWGNLIANIIWPPSVAGNLNYVIFFALNFTQYIAWLKNSWLKNYCYSLVTQLLSYHSKAFRNYWRGGGEPYSSRCPPLLLSCSFISVWYATPGLLCT